MSELTSEPQRVAAAVIRREARRERTLAVLSVALWIIAAFLIAGVVLPLLAKMKHAGQLLTHPPDGQPVTAQQIAETLAEVLPGAAGVAAIILGMALMVGMLASICSVALALTIRRTTLRQVNEGLAQLSAQLRDMKRS